MSYHMPVHFKQLKSPNEVFEVIDQVYDARKSDVPEILVSIWHELPSSFRDIEDKHDAFRLDEPFILSALQQKYIYWPELNLLGLVGYPHSLGRDTCDIFPCFLYFQNQSDQDYDFDSYDTIPLFRQIARQIEKTKGMVVDNLPDGNLDGIDYDLKSLVYETITGLLGIEDYVYEEKLTNAHTFTVSHHKHPYDTMDLQGHYMALYDTFHHNTKGNDE